MLAFLHALLIGVLVFLILYQKKSLGSRGFLWGMFFMSAWEGLRQDTLGLAGIAANWVEPNEFTWILFWTVTVVMLVLLFRQAITDYNVWAVLSNLKPGDSATIGDGKVTKGK